jgi:membrane-associated phospholipid phosphatase
VPAPALHLTILPPYFPSARLRALGWAVALEAALLVALLAALRGFDVSAEAAPSAMVLPLTLLQLPGWLVAAACLFPFDSTGGPPDVLFTGIMGVANIPALYALIRLSDASRRRSSKLAESLSRPFPDSIPILVLAVLVPMYMVIAVVIRGRTLFIPELALDGALPLQPGWVLVYWSQWVFSFLPVFVVRGHELRRRVVLAYLTIVIVAYVGFLLYPTLGPRPPHVAGEGFFAWNLRALYEFDPPYNCFPSLHVAYSFLAALTAYRVHRGLGLAALVWSALIGVSTLYTKQHYIVDVFAGILIAYAAYALFLRSFPREVIAPADRRSAPIRALAVPAIYAIVVACFWVAYATS